MNHRHFLRTGSTLLSLLLSLLLSIVLVAQQPLLAQSVSAPLSGGTCGGSAQRLNLDLSSITLSMPAAAAGSDTVAVIDTRSNAVVATIPVGRGPDGIAVSPSGKQIYLANSWGTVSVIDATSNTVTATIKGESSPVGVAVTAWYWLQTPVETLDLLKDETC
jgi:YVTN family beta-propeller protein